MRSSRVRTGCGGRLTSAPARATRGAGSRTHLFPLSPTFRVQSDCPEPGACGLSDCDHCVITTRSDLGCSRSDHPVITPRAGSAQGPPAHRGCCWPWLLTAATRSGPCPLVALVLSAAAGGHHAAATWPWPWRCRAMPAACRDRHDPWPAVAPAPVRSLPRPGLRVARGNARPGPGPVRRLTTAWALRARWGRGHGRARARTRGRPRAWKESPLPRRTAHHDCSRNRLSPRPARAPCGH